MHSHIFHIIIIILHLTLDILMNIIENMQSPLTTHKYTIHQIRVKYNTIHLDRLFLSYFY